MDNKKEVSKYVRFKNNIVWKEMVEILNKRLDILEATINTVGLNEIKYTEKDIAILTKAAIKNIIDYPQIEIDNLMSNIDQNRPLIEDNPYEDGGLMDIEEDEDDESK